jgi:hypothetical protein
LGKFGFLEVAIMNLLEENVMLTALNRSEVIAKED